MNRRLALAVLWLLGRVCVAQVTVNDAGDSTNPCAATGTGTCTLRDAITFANTQSDTPIVFAIPGAGVHTVVPASALPTITARVTIDGYSQAGASPNTNPPDQGTNAVLMIEIDGSNTGAAFDSRVIGFGGAGADGSVVRGLVINRGNAGVRIDGSADAVVEGCFIGTDPSGTVAHGHAEAGVVITSGATNTTVGGVTAAGRNLISANGIDGIAVGVDNAAGGSGHLFVGNLIGTDATGTLSLSGSQIGVELMGSATNVRVGGSSAAERNVISGNPGGGVRLRNPVTESLVEGNYVGTDVTGTLPLGNGTYGISVEGPGNTIGDVLGAGNVVAASGTNGLEISTNGTVVYGNWIGFNLTEAAGLGNAQWGILVNGNDSVIGGLAIGQANWIQNNGTGAFGGIRVESGSGNDIGFNNIWLNAGLGIDLGTIGVDPNDPLDADSGPNFLQNFPIIASAIDTLNGTEIKGVLHGAPGTQYRVDFYGNPNCVRRPHDYLQGSFPIGSTIVTTGSVSGVGTFDFTGAFGANVTATATDPNGNTSEFSQRMVFWVAPGSGPPAGGTAISVHGTDFLDGATVTIGPSAASDVSVANFTQLSATTPPLAAGTVYDVTVVNTDGSAGTLKNGWVSDFLDVPNPQQFYAYVSTLVANGITVGVGGGLYGVNDNTLRQQMAVFMLKGRYGLCYTPPSCTGIFADVPCPSTFADWIEGMAAEGITGGCGGGNYCPQNPVRRDQMAVFLLKAEHGSTYVPPACQGVFGDVACPSQFADWIEQLATEMITGGCGGGNYCPGNPTTRGQMAVFITKTFNLQ